MPWPVGNYLARRQNQYGFLGAVEKRDQWLAFKLKKRFVFLSLIDNICADSWLYNNKASLRKLYSILEGGAGRGRGRETCSPIPFSTGLETQVCMALLHSVRVQVRCISQDSAFLFERSAFLCNCRFSRHLSLVTAMWARHAWQSSLRRRRLRGMRSTQLGLTAWSRM